MIDFKFKPFEEMTPEDYAKVGFKSGLEIHQQLLTEKKLFCRCPAAKYNKKYNAEILRHMRPTLSELGEYDGTALMEFKTNKNIIYRINRESMCTYEMDDTPPFLINEDALDSAIEVGLLFESNIVDELHIARKQYLDGSIPTGFQRTAIVALDGKVPYKDREIDIIQMSIEEDSCREISDIGHDRYYNTDRLGMPLIETVTAPQMKTPIEVAEVALILSKVARCSNKVRRGAGAAREDVNVSVEGGTRIEIKGVSSINSIPLLTYNEAMRQWNLLGLREELNRRGITKDTFKATSKDVTKIIKHPHYLPIKTALNEGSKLKAVIIKGYKGILHWQTQTNTYFSKEISDRVRVIACLHSIPNIIHSDSMGESLTSHEWSDVFKALNAEDNDTIVLVWGKEDDTKTAVNEIIIRAKEAAIGIPSETRQALRDGTNGFERILPGADRMYPDTDLPPKMIKEKRLKNIKNHMFQVYYKREKWYKELGIPEDTIDDLSISPFGNLFEKVVKEYQLDPTLAAVILIQYPKRFKKGGLNTDVFTEDIFDNIFKAVKDGTLLKSGILFLMGKIAEEDKFEPSDIAQILNEQEVSEQIDLLKSVLKLDNNTELLMGKILQDNRLRIDAKLLADKIGFRKS